MQKTKVNELENVLLDQIEKLNDDSIFEDETKAKILIERSNSIADLANAFTGLTRTKLDVVREMKSNGGMYEKYMGIEE
ncbi:hypothetical protein [Treponema sp.]|uniref:hypothetical protein n=1 Tax=Treponema sp. TaxID=166 RepID=UPI0025F0DC92|nr:hypothetical protein [Treponema sp.]MCR5218605.1 hypothetical protein [Treponema sp.]